MHTEGVLKLFKLQFFPFFLITNGRYLFSSRILSVDAMASTNIERAAAGRKCNLSSFQEKVYEFVKTIPSGKVLSYGAVAREIDSHARAVGTAMKNNPFCEVP